jgi:tripartite ATP-independent transporter DctM subunit
VIRPIGRLEEVGYPRNYAAGLIASGATTGVLIPPSISYIIAGIILGISASTLFLAAFIPGTMIVLGMVVTNVLINRSRKYETGGRFMGPREIVQASWSAKFGLAIPIIILGGIYAGIFTPTEAAAVAVGVTLVIGLFYSVITLEDFPGMFERSALLNGIISPNIAVGIIFGQVISVLGIPGQVAALVVGLTNNFYLVGLIMVIVFVAAGAALEITPNIIIFGPLLLPLAGEIGMDPIHYTIILITSLGLGPISPPIGLTLFVLAGISGESVLDVSWRAFPFLISMAVVTLIVAWFPGLFMWLVP